MDEPDRSTIWPYEDGEPGDFFYARYAHPTGTAAERALGELEGGEALLYASGMAATSTVVLALAQPGTTIALAEGAYFGTSRLFDELQRWGLRYVEYDQRDAPPDADIIWVEAPANPLLTMPDFAAATGTGALTVCDATVATPAPTRIPPRTTKLRASPRTTRTLRLMRYAPFILAVKTPLPYGQSRSAPETLRPTFACFVQRFRRTANETAKPSFPFPS